MKTTFITLSLAAVSMAGHLKVPTALAQLDLGEEGDVCLGFDENTGVAFPDCEDGLVCATMPVMCIPGSCNRCVEAAGLGENCEGWDEMNSEYFPPCERGLKCKSSGGFGIPGTDKTCVRA